MFMFFYCKLKLFIFKNYRIIQWSLLLLCSILNNNCLCVGDDSYLTLNGEPLSVHQVKELIHFIRIFENTNFEISVFNELVDCFSKIQQEKTMTKNVISLQDLDVQANNQSETIISFFHDFNYQDILKIEKISPTTSIDGEVGSDGRSISVNSVDTEGCVSRPSSPIVDEIFKQFSQNVFNFVKNDGENNLLVDQKRPLSEFAQYLYKGFFFLDSVNGLSSIQKISIIAKFSTQIKTNSDFVVSLSSGQSIQSSQLLVTLPNGETVDMSPYLLECFKIYRKTFYQTPSNLGMALRSGCSLVTGVSLPESNIPIAIRFTLTTLYKQVLELSKKLNI